MVDRDHCFTGLDGLERAEKPRSAGLTMVVDWGLGPHAQDDLLATGGPYFDFAKVAVGLSRLLPNSILKAKIDGYRQRQVEAFPGGQYLEYAEVHGFTDAYLPAVLQAGYKWVEVSDNLVPAGLAWKERMIRRASKDFGLAVLGEVGRKEGLDRSLSLSDDAGACMAAGARIILLEAAELVDPEIGPEVEAVVQAVGLEQVMFELPGPWIEGVSLSDIHRMKVDLVQRYGHQVNLGNVAPADLLPLEAYRRGLGVNAGGPQD